MPEQRVPAPRSLQEPTTLLHLALKSALLKLFGDFGIFLCVCKPAFSLCPCNKAFSAPNSIVSVCLASLCFGHMNLCQVTICPSSTPGPSLMEALVNSYFFWSHFPICKRGGCSRKIFQGVSGETFLPHSGEFMAPVTGSGNLSGSTSQDPFPGVERPPPSIC